MALKPARILLHDYSGHAFTGQLSRWLSARGHEVHHFFSADINAPRGLNQRREDDPPGLHIFGLGLGEPLRKYSFTRRRFHERHYGRLLAQRIEALSPDIVLACNTPLDVLAPMEKCCARLGIPWVYWLQDIYSEAIRRYVTRRMPGIGHVAAWAYARLDRRLMQSAAHIIAITDDFARMVEDMGVPADKVSVIENWGALELVSPGRHDNEWARAQGLADKHCLIYSGTLGLKHNPGLIAALARHFSDRADVRVVVISEGLGADWLRAARSQEGLDNLVVLNYQPAESLGDVLASATVLLAILEPDAGVLSVPSKVLSGLCAGRAQLLSVPAENLAARTVLRERAGLVVTPGDEAAWLAAAERLLDDAGLRDQLGANGRSYAARAFDPGAISDRFEALIDRFRG